MVSHFSGERGPRVVNTANLISSMLFNSDDLAWHNRVFFFSPTSLAGPPLLQKCGAPASAGRPRRCRIVQLIIYAGSGRKRGGWTLGLRHHCVYLFFSPWYSSPMQVVVAQRGASLLGILQHHAAGAIGGAPPNSSSGVMRRKAWSFFSSSGKRGRWELREGLCG